MLKPIPPLDLACRPVHLLQQRWMLLSAGTLEPKAWNTMTIAWGSFGVMWSKPVFIAVVRPTRHTYSFMESHPDFTACVLPERFKPALELCGKVTGRVVDKAAQAGLTPVPASAVAAPCFAESELVVECRKLYFQDLDPRNFLDGDIALNYGANDYHRAYWGEIVALRGTAAYVKPD